MAKILMADVNFTTFEGLYLLNYTIKSAQVYLYLSKIDEKFG